MLFLKTNLDLFNLEKTFPMIEYFVKILDERTEGNWDIFNFGNKIEHGVHQD